MVVNTNQVPWEAGEGCQCDSFRAMWTFKRQILAQVKLGKAIAFSTPGASPSKILRTCKLLFGAFLLTFATK